MFPWLLSLIQEESFIGHSPGNTHTEAVLYNSNMGIKRFADSDIRFDPYSNLYLMHELC
jgi:hypothetical protein